MLLSKHIKARDIRNPSWEKAHSIVAKWAQNIIIDKGLVDCGTSFVGVNVVGSLFGDVPHQRKRKRKFIQYNLRPNLGDNANV